MHVHGADTLLFEHICCIFACSVPQHSPSGAWEWRIRSRCGSNQQSHVTPLSAWRTPPPLTSAKNRSRKWLKLGPHFHPQQGKTAISATCPTASYWRPTSCRTLTAWKARRRNPKKKMFNLWRFCGVTETELKRRPCLCPAVIIASSFILEALFTLMILVAFLCCVHMVNCFKVLQMKFSAKCEPTLDLRVSFSFLTLLNSFSCHFVLLALDLSVLFPPSDFLSAPSLSFTQSRSPQTVFLDLPLCLCLHLLFYLLCSIGHCVLFLIHSLPFWLLFFLQCLAGLLSFPRSLSAFTHLFWL